jgi:hypothetical protein
MMAARIITTGAQLNGESPTVLFALPPGPNREISTSSWYAASRDGQRFLVNTFVEGTTPITVLLNWKPGT